MDNIEANLNEGLLFRGKSQLSKSARAWLIALLKTVLAFSCWMRWSCSSSAKVFLHLSEGNFSQVGLNVGKLRASEVLQARNKSKAKPTFGTSTRCYWPLGGATSELLAHHRLLYFKCKIWSQSDLAHQEKVWALWHSRWKRKCMARGDSQRSNICRPWTWGTGSLRSLVERPGKGSRQVQYENRADSWAENVFTWQGYF